MKSIDEILKDDHVVEVIQKGIDGAAFNVKIKYRLYNVIASNGGGWDHALLILFTHHIHQRGTLCAY